MRKAPEHIPGYFDPTDRRILSDGKVITSEAFPSTRSRVLTEASDGWTLVGAWQVVGAIRTHDDHHQGQINRRHTALSDHRSEVFS